MPHGDAPHGDAPHGDAIYGSIGFGRAKYGQPHHFGGSNTPQTNAMNASKDKNVESLQQQFASMGNPMDHNYMRECGTPNTTQPKLPMDTEIESLRQQILSKDHQIQSLKQIIVSKDKQIKTLEAQNLVVLVELEPSLAVATPNEDDEYEFVG
jgi:hypothetical protein